MVAIKAHFDGSQIQLPPEFHNVPPGEVLIVVRDPVPVSAQPLRSIWDVIGRATGTRTAEDIQRQIDEDRDEWDRR